MFLTYEYLEKHGACRPGKAWFKRRFPNGGEVKDIIKERTVSEDLVDWAIRNINLTDEEWQAYWEKCEINCPGKERTIQRSKKITNCENVIRSTDISDSIEVHHSNKVRASNTVLQSEEVENSEKVFLSSYVYNSKKVYNSANINDSYNIVQSNFVIDSNNVIYANNVEGSSFVIAQKPGLTENIKNSHFVNNCANIENCLFCSSVKNSKYYLFNRPIDEKRYHIIEKQMRNILQEEEFKFVQKWPKDEIPLTEPEKIKAQASWCSLSSKFWKWIKTLPGYDPSVMYMITLDKNVFK